MLVKNRLLLSPDGAPAAVIPPPPKSDAPADTIPLPRAEYEKLIALRERVPTLEEAAKKAETLEGSFKTLFARDADPTARNQIVIQQMRVNGYSDEEIKQHLEQDEEPEPKGRGNGRGEEDEELKQMKGEVATMGNALRQQALERAHETLRTSIDTALDKATGLQTSLKQLAEVDEESKKMAQELVPTIREEARAQTIQILTKKRNSGVRLTNEEMAKTASEATQATIRKYELILGKASRIGKAPQLDDYDFQNSKPVPAPQFNPNASRADVERANEQWANDYLLREAMSLENTNGRL